MKSLWSSQDAPPKGFLIVGLGNPGSSYEKTRHNIGFLVVHEMAKRLGAVFRHKPGLSGELAKSEACALLLPTTYMNSSGECVRLGVKMLKVPLSHLMIVTDDVALPFGQLRMREGGTSGGHNGLKSIEGHLRTKEYPRLRVGVGSPRGENLSDYVLGKFNVEESRDLSSVLERACEALTLWMDSGIKVAMTRTNIRGDE